MVATKRRPMSASGIRQTTRRTATGKTARRPDQAPRAARLLANAARASAGVAAIISSPASEVSESVAVRTLPECGGDGARRASADNRELNQRQSRRHSGDQERVDQHPEQAQSVGHGQQPYAEPRPVYHRERRERWHEEPWLVPAVHERHVD